MTTRAKKTMTKANANKVDELVQDNNAAMNVGLKTQDVENVEAGEVPEMIGNFGEDYITKVKIAKVIGGNYENRVAFVVDGMPLAGYNDLNEEAAVTTFGLNVNELCNQVRQQVPELAMFEIAAMGKRINPQAVAFIFQGAEMEIERIYKEKGEERETGNINDKYSANCFVTKIKKVTTHIPQQVAQLLNMLLMQQVSQPMQVAASPFNVR